MDSTLALLEASTSSAAEAPDTLPLSPTGHLDAGATSLSEPLPLVHTARGEASPPRPNSRSDCSSNGTSGEDHNSPSPKVPAPLPPSVVVQAMNCGENVRLRKEVTASGSPTIAVDDADGTHLGTFGEECVSFELRCKDSERIHRWLEGIETKMLPGLLTLLAEEVQRRLEESPCTSALARPEFKSSPPSWNPASRISMVEAHSKLRAQLLGAAEGSTKCEEVWKAPAG